MSTPDSSPSPVPSVSPAALSIHNSPLLQRSYSDPALNSPNLNHNRTTSEEFLPESAAHQGPRAFSWGEHNAPSIGVNSTTSGGSLGSNPPIDPSSTGGGHSIGRSDGDGSAMGQSLSPQTISSQAGMGIGLANLSISGNCGLSTQLWKPRTEQWTEQIDELVRKGSYLEALALLESIDKTLLPDKDSIRKHIKGLHAVWMFAEGKYDDAMATFISLETNPAKVVALYPDSVAGRLSAPKVQWFELHGGPSPTGFIETFESPPRQETEADASPEDLAVLPSILPQSPTIVRRGDDNSSIISSRSKERYESDDLRRRIECLLRFLTDRRPKLGGALLALQITPAQASEYPSLSSFTVLELPNLPPSSLTPNHLIRFAQIVDTVLYKSYLVIRPGLLGALCRLSNWCEVSEVEQVLKKKGVGVSSTR